MNPIEKDKAYLEAGIPELGNYLLSKELFWPISARGFSLPRLTISGILLSKTRLDAFGERIESLVIRLDGVRSKWRVAWERKASREVQARMRLWSNYLSDYRHSPENHADTYKYEVRNRVMLHLLLDELLEPPQEQGALIELDKKLRANLLTNEFIWDPDLEAGFSREVYWYLYGELKY